MALFKAEWFGRKTPSPADYFFGNYRLWAHLGRLIPLRPPRGLLELVGVHPFVPLPFPVKKGLMVERKGEGSSTGEGSAIRVFLDTHIEFFEPEIGEALVRLLKRRGLGVSFVDAGCCGRPAFSRGMLEKARREARKVLGNLGNTPTVIVEPSCLSIFRLDARSLGITIAGEETRLLSPAEFLADLEKTFDTSRRDRIFFHPHCHSRAMDQERLWARVLERFGEVTVSDAGCCGMAGGFGYDRETVALATAVAEDRFLPELRRAGKEGKILLVEGRSCREMAHRAGIKTRHPLEYIAGRLDGAEGRMR
ncbi:MAG: hypothetical protein D6679_06650 [Candidatus Hydrogenedentota bacterium]|nr:MAG: hypothetical protein D6679_06650 [Candidatus Hydrogenedentota bacterium]